MKYTFNKEDYYRCVQGFIAFDELVDSEVAYCEETESEYRRTEIWHERSEDVWSDLVSIAHQCLGDEIRDDKVESTATHSNLTTYALGDTGVFDAFIYKSPRTQNAILFVGFTERALDDIVADRLGDLYRESDEAIREVYGPAAQVSDVSDDQAEIDQAAMIQTVCEDLTAQMTAITNDWFDRLSTYHIIRTAQYTNSPLWRLTPDASWGEALQAEVLSAWSTLQSGKAVWGVRPMIDPGHLFVLGISNRGHLNIVEADAARSTLMPLVSARTRGELVTAIGLASRQREIDGCTTYIYKWTDFRAGDLSCLPGVALSLWRILQGETPKAVERAVRQRQDVAAGFMED